MSNQVSNSTSSSDKISRILVGLVAVVCSVYALAVLRNEFSNGFDMLGLMLGLGVGTAAWLAWWFVLSAYRPEKWLLFKYTVVCALLCGGAAFATGFFGPMIFSPQSNQGPFLGIFVTGPLGLTVGAVLGWVFGLVKCRKGSAR
jgi:hypothetical protein